MKDEAKTKEELLRDLRELRGRLAALESDSSTVCPDEEQQRRMEAALREYERKCRVIFDQTFQFIGLLTPDGTLVEANRTALQFTGARPSDVIGKPFWDTPWWRHSKPLQERLKEAVKQAAAGEFVRFEVTHTAADGELRCIDFSLKPVRDERGEVVYLIPEGRDISEQKRIEKELQRYREHLEVMVRERTAQLEAANEDLKKEMQERRRAEEAVREREKTLVEIVQGSPIPTFVIDTEHVVTHWNKACETLTGIPAEKMIGTRDQWRAFYPGERPVMADLIVDQASEAELAAYYGDCHRPSVVREGAWEAERFFPSLGKKGKWLFFTAAPLRRSDGVIMGAIETLQDLTERHLTEDALRLDEARLEALLKLNQMGEGSMQEIAGFALDQAVSLTKSKMGYVGFVDADGRTLTIHAWSAAVARECTIEAKPTVFAPETMGLWGEALRQRKPVITNDYRAPNPWKKGYPPGHPRLIRHMNIPVFEGDRIVALAGVANKADDYDGSDVRQITLLMQGMWRLLERRRAEEELRRHRDHLEELVRERTADLIESEEKYRTLVENVPLVVYRVSLDGKVLFVNHFVTEIFGYSPAEIFRCPALLLKDCVCSEDLEIVKELREKTLHKGQEFLAEYRIRHKKGHVVYVMDHAIPFESPDGRIKGADGIIMDVTSRIKLREELVRAEEQKTITEVSARLAHEIRNPLVSAGGFARRLLASMDQHDPNRAKVEIIVKEVRRLETILRMILNYLQPVKLYLSKNDPNGLVENALNAVESELRESGVAVRLDLSPDVPEITVDRLQIELVLETLIKQAINQIKDGGELFIGTTAAEGVLKLVMKYPVKHVSRDDVEHFFYPFISSEKAYDTADLPLSKIVINKHGGDIDVRLEKPDTLVLRILMPL
ncbi:PAS domain S-box protein [Desulfatiglans anilini]|uniref:PAS domain S-box protein n=1 Tax=Desulfatiglans anilini TaxID=90728 RepID=UPI00068430AC|nr:PAS domain S-box protein [Desulfatiglans anilini]